MNLKYFTYIGTTDVAPINEQIELYPELWDVFSLRRVAPGTPHSGMSDCWIRYRSWDEFDPEDPKKFVDRHDSVWYPAWYKLTSIHKLVFDLMWSVRATRLGGIICTQIPPGGRIEPHSDRGSWHPELHDTKIYVVLKSNDQCVFRCEDEKVVMKEGEIWIVNNLVEHEVTNDGTTPRRTLIISTSTK